MKAGQQIRLTINFVNPTNTQAEHRVEVEEAKYVPCMGDYIHNDKDTSYYYEVTEKNVFINEVHSHIIIKAKYKSNT